MIKYKTELINLPVVFEDVMIGIVRDLVIDNENGKVLAFSLDKQSKRIIPVDRLIFFEDRYLARELNPIFESDDILRIKAILEKGLNIKKQQVKIKSSGKILGKVSNYSVVTELGIAKQLVVETSKLWFLGLSKERLIDTDCIFSIETDTIWISDEYEKVTADKEAETELDKIKAEPVMGSA
jgi:sporulation protein YlmC with PRC-barrel domain